MQKFVVLSASIHEKQVLRVVDFLYSNLFWKISGRFD